MFVDYFFVGCNVGFFVIGVLIFVLNIGLEYIVGFVG